MFKVNNKDTRTTPLACVSIVNFEYEIVGWVLGKFKHIRALKISQLK